MGLVSLSFGQPNWRFPDLWEIHATNSQWHPLLFFMGVPHAVDDTKKGRIIARTQGVLTQLIFDHALRVRAFSTHPKGSLPGAQKDVETSNVHDGQTNDESEPVHANSSALGESIAAEAAPSDAGIKHQPISLGMLNNLIATDIANIDDGQYWILTGKPVLRPDR